jgi:hypothetical protein
MSTALLVQAFAPPEGWFPKDLDQIVSGRQYKPIPEELLLFYMASSWAYEQMCQYGKFVQQGANEGRNQEEDEMKILAILMNRSYDASEILRESFWSQAGSPTSVAVKQVDGKMELVLLVESC